MPVIPVLRGAEAGGSWVWGHSELYSKTLSQNESMKSETCWLEREHGGCCQDMDNKEIGALRKCPHAGTCSGWLSHVLSYWHVFLDSRLDNLSTSSPFQERKAVSGLIIADSASHYRLLTDRKTTINKNLWNGRAILVPCEQKGGACKGQGLVHRCSESHALSVPRTALTPRTAPTPWTAAPGSVLLNFVILFL